MALLDDVKKVLKVTRTEQDTEITDLILACKKDLVISGIDASFDETDPLIKRAITIYCKAHYGYDNQDAEKLERAYLSLKTHLMMSSDYAVD